MRCSVVCGVTLRLLVINISSYSPAINTAAYYQRCVITSETVAVHRRPRLQHLPVAALTQAVKPDIGSESRVLPTPPAFDVAVRGVPGRILLCRLPRKRTRMAWLPDGEKKFDDMFIHFGMIHNLMLNNTVILKSGLHVTQGHSNWYHSKA